MITFRAKIRVTVMITFRAKIRVRVKPAPPYPPELPRPKCSIAGLVRVRVR